MDKEKDKSAFNQRNTRLQVCKPLYMPLQIANVFYAYPIMKHKQENFRYSDFDTVKYIALTFPGTVESTSHEQTPSVKIRGKLMCRLHDSGEFIPIHLDFESRNKYLDRYPEIFHLPS